MSSDAKSISPSQQFQGNDGAWSTFPIIVGDPPVTLLVLPATSGRSTWVVAPEGCPDGAPTDCVLRRGQVYDYERSSSFRPTNGTESFYRLNFGTESSLNSALPSYRQYIGNGWVGNDTIRFGFNGDDTPALENQLVVEYSSNVTFLGRLGLSWANETVKDYQDIHPSVLGRLRQMNATSSNYWGYTAGAHYRDNAYGSLTFGGYDASRGNVDNVLTVQMDQNSTRDLVVQIEKITLFDGTQNQDAGGGSTAAFIDSVVPEIWLPEDVCDNFQKTFGLVWNDTVSMYLVNESLHDDLVNRNVSVTFSLAANASGVSRSIVDISLPYAAFDLTAAWPLLANLTADNTATMRYFPLKRANNSNQVYLGRTFLQEAYVAADYDNFEFHVSPATFDSDSQDIRTVTYPPKSGSSLSGGAIAGIVVGVVAALAILGGLLWWFCRRKRKGDQKKQRRGTLGTSSIGDNTTIAEWNNEVQMQQVENYKPAEVSGEELDRFKPELDATATARARGAPTERHELWAGSVRRASDQSRASISPLEERHRSNRFSHNRTISSNSFGQPSPPTSDHPSPPLGASGRDSPFGQPSPHSGARTPATGDQDRSWFGGAPMYYELHGRSRDSPRSPSSPVRNPEEVPLSGDNALSQSERETRRSGFIEEFDRPSEPQSRT